MTLFGPLYWASVASAAVLHEGAHLAAAYVGGVRIKRFGLNWRGPYIVREPGTAMQNICTSLSGPMINLLLCLLCFRWYGTFAFVNGFLAIMNMLPIPSSDGLRVYRICKELQNRRHYATITGT
jgi:Zn-dependent protease